MKQPSIPDAKQLAYALRAKGVLVLALGDGQYATASFGMRKEECRDMRKISERIAELIENGTIKIPESLQ